MAVKKITPHHYPLKLEQYERVVETIEGLERKGDTIPYTSVNGHMFSYLGQDGKMALKLPKEALQDFIKKHKTSLHQAYGIVQKEYATVPDDLLADTQELSRYLQISYTYTAQLKPRSSKKAKK